MRIILVSTVVLLVLTGIVSRVIGSNPRYLMIWAKVDGIPVRCDSRSVDEAKQRKTLVCTYRVLPEGDNSDGYYSSAYLEYSQDLDRNYRLSNVESCIPSYYLHLVSAKGASTKVSGKDAHAVLDCSGDARFGDSWKGSFENRYIDVMLDTLRIGNDEESAGFTLIKTGGAL